jgi:hypothetical protein
MNTLSTDYRYHPEGADLAALCKQFEQQLPNASFGFDIDTRSGKLRIKCWSSTKDRYYEQLLHNSHEPNKVLETFVEKCGTRLITA